MGVYEGFWIGKYASIETIKPTERRLNFINQIYIYLDQKRVARCEYDDAYTHTNFSFFGFPFDGALEGVSTDSMTKERHKYLHHCDDEFIQGIIQQRKQMIAKLRAELCAVRDKQLDESRAEHMRKWEMNQEAMERSVEREREREEEQVKHRHRVDAANAEVRVYVYERRKRRELRAKIAAQRAAKEAAHEQWVAEQKKQNKSKKV